MSDANTLINIGELAKPATILIEKISDAIGGVCRPWQIKRVVDAEVQAEIIRATGRLQVSELEQRGLERMIQIEGKKQENIEQITFNAIQSLEESANPADIERDWITNFFDKCSNVSDIEMQDLWGKILAGEANKPGSFSKRTINSVASLDKTEAHLFTSLCRFGLHLGNFQPLVFDLNHPIYAKHDITFGSLMALETTGLISFNSVTGFIFELKVLDFFVTYNNEKIIIKIPENSKIIPIGNVLLTKMGMDLAPICGATSIPEFSSVIKEKWNTYIVKE